MIRSLKGPVYSATMASTSAEIVGSDRVWARSPGPIESHELPSTAFSMRKYRPTALFQKVWVVVQDLLPIGSEARIYRY